MIPLTFALNDDGENDVSQSPTTAARESSRVHEECASGRRGAATETTTAGTGRTRPTAQVIAESLLSQNTARLQTSYMTLHRGHVKTNTFMNDRIIRLFELSCVMCVRSGPPYV